MKQMVIDERNRIEFLVGCGRNVPQVAKELGRNPSTIRNELLKHRVDSDKRYGCSNRICARFDECARKVFTGFAERLGKNTPKCHKACPEFREAVCHRLAKPPFVCNGCEKERECPLKKKFYIASVAQAQYESEQSLSRTGVHPDDATVREMFMSFTISIFPLRRKYYIIFLAPKGPHPIPFGLRSCYQIHKRQNHIQYTARTELCKKKGMASGHAFLCSWTTFPAAREQLAAREHSAALVGRSRRARRHPPLASPPSIGGATFAD